MHFHKEERMATPGANLDQVWSCADKYLQNRMQNEIGFPKDLSEFYMYTYHGAKMENHWFERVVADNEDPASPPIPEQLDWGFRGIWGP